MTRTVRYNDLNVYDKVCLCDKVWYDMIRYNMIEEFTVDSKAERGQLRASFTNVDQAWTKFRFDLDLGLAVICVAPTQFRSNHELKLGLTLNCRGRRIKLWLSVQLALNSGPRTVIPAIWVQIGDKFGSSAGVAYRIQFQVINQWIPGNYFYAWMQVEQSFVGAICMITVILILTFL